MNEASEIITYYNKRHILVRLDLLEFEQHLHDTLIQIIPFESHAIYFPQEDIHKKPEWIPEESKLLIPLYHQKKFLGVFMAKNPSPSHTKLLLPILPELVSLCLTNLELYKNGRLDLLTGLMNRQVFIHRLTEEISYIQTSFNHAMYGTKDDHIPHKSSLGIIVVRFNGLAKLTHETSYGFTEKFIEGLAQVFLKSLPKQATAARTGDYEFALFLPDAKSTQCAELAITLTTVMKNYKQHLPFTDKQIRIIPHIGYTLYPKDLDGTKHITIDNHANILLHKASLAAEVAHSRLTYGVEQIMAYSNLLYEGGQIQQTLPLSRIITNLGRSIGAREGQRFSIWSNQHHIQEKTNQSPQPIYKGEMILLEIHELDSIGEIIHLGDPTWPIELGDVLTLLPEEQNISKSNDHTNTLSHKYDPLTGLLCYNSFLSCFSEIIHTMGSFTLTLIHADIKPIGNIPNKSPNHIMTTLAKLCQNAFIESKCIPLIGGKFALNSLIFLHSDTSELDLYKSYSQLCTQARQELNLRVGVGIAYWPFLHFRASDMLECCRKALEYALLLPAPHVGIFDSLAINISADKKHCSGDMFSAIEEYKLALLADKKNVLAWNSLGVCMATLGYHSEAQRHFEEALQLNPNDSNIFYNLGVLHQTLGDIEPAKNYLTQCLDSSPSHFYAIIRLGELAEINKQIENAIMYFKQAITIDEKSSIPYRHLAKIVLKEGNKEKAREYLHEALLRNPRDAITLTFMAKLYLDGGEDPELAEALARQSISQRPDRKSSWLELARSLEAQGKKSEAYNVLAKSNEY